MNENIERVFLAIAILSVDLFCLYLCVNILPYDLAS